MQLRLPNGQRPDAVVSLNSGLQMVVDSKVPSLPDNPSNKMERKKFVTKIKSIVRKLSKKQYPSQISNAMDTTWMVLPNEAYLRAMYDQKGKDDYNIHQYALDRKIKLVAPESLRSDIQTLQYLHS